MSVRDDVLTAVIALAQAVSTVYSDISRGALPADNGITMTAATGAPETTFLDKSTTEQLTVVCNGKHSNQQTVIAALDDIHAALTRATSYPSGAGWQITNVETIAAPGYIGRETNNQWLYGSSLRVKFYYRGE